MSYFSVLENIFETFPFFSDQSYFGILIELFDAGYEGRKKLKFQLFLSYKRENPEQ